MTVRDASFRLTWQIEVSFRMVKDSSLFAVLRLSSGRRDREVKKKVLLTYWFQVQARWCQRPSESCRKTCQDFGGWRRTSPNKFSRRGEFNFDLQVFSGELEWGSSHSGMSRGRCHHTVTDAPLLSPHRHVMICCANFDVDKSTLQRVQVIAWFPSWYLYYNQWVYINETRLRYPLRNTFFRP